MTKNLVGSAYLAVDPRMQEAIEIMSMAVAGFSVEPADVEHDISRMREYLEGHFPDVLEREMKDATRPD